MIELCIPQTGEETRNSKDLVFSVLSEQESLTAMELTNAIRKTFNAGITYQAIKKAIVSLLEKDVLVKSGKRYSLNRHWLLRTRGMIDRLLTEEGKGKEVRRFSGELLSKDYAVYTLTSLIDLDNFWDDMLHYLAEHLREDEEKTFISRTHYSWWVLLNLGREVKLFDEMKKKVRCYYLILKDHPLNQWARKLYAEKFGPCVIAQMEASEEESINLLGDTIIQVKYPKSVMQKMRSFYRKYTSTEEMSVREITELANMPCEVKFIVYRNPEIAESLRKKYLAVFPKKR